MQPHRLRQLPRRLTATIVVVACVLLCAACTHRRKDLRVALPPTFGELARRTLGAENALDRLIERGPVAFDVKVNATIAVNGVRYAADVVVPRVMGRAPLVILQHGNHSRKEAHREQAEHLASHGFVALSLQMPNHDRWLDNGLALAAVVKKIARYPELISRRIDPRRIVLAGHSFGGSAATIAAGDGAPIVGVVLLDPAVVGDEVIAAMQRARVPAVLIGSDRDVFRTRRRPAFARNWSGPFAEVSIKGATHDDAQSPSMFALTTLGFDPFTSDAQRATFRAALTAGALAIAADRSLDFAWRVLSEADRRGMLTEAARRAAEPVVAKEAPEVAR